MLRWEETSSGSSFGFKPAIAKENLKWDISVSANRILLITDIFALLGSLPSFLKAWRWEWWNEYLNEGINEPCSRIPAFFCVRSSRIPSIWPILSSRLLCCSITLIVDIMRCSRKRDWLCTKRRRAFCLPENNKNARRPCKWCQPLLGKFFGFQWKQIKSETSFKCHLVLFPIIQMELSAFMFPLKKLPLPNVPNRYFCPSVQFSHMIQSNVSRRPYCLANGVVLSPKTRNGTSIQKEFNKPIGNVIVKKHVHSECDAIVRRC